MWTKECSESYFYLLAKEIKSTRGNKGVTFLMGCNHVIKRVVPT